MITTGFYIVCELIQFIVKQSLLKVRGIRISFCLILLYLLVVIILVFNVLDSLAIWTAFWVFIANAFLALRFSVFVLGRSNSSAAGIAHDIFWLDYLNSVSKFWIANFALIIIWNGLCSINWLRNIKHYFSFIMQFIVINFHYFIVFLSFLFSFAFLFMNFLN